MGGCTNLRVRHGIQQHVVHGEADSVDCAQLAVNRMDLKELIGQYSPRDIFNFDESALFYRLSPKKTLATVNRYGKKSEKDSITVAMCCNMTSTEKMDLVVHRQVEETQAFCKANTKQMEFLCFNNQTAWQTRSTFAEWLRHFDSKMHGKRVLLLLDNASCHYGTAECYNVKLEFLPPNMIAHLQQFGAGKSEWMFS